ncbi:MAG: sulfur carrier protein ThiS [Gammaproteobacteria bacterium]|nr:MAG: sulfur carrier protein ThiS [Gammaproteobacteria bacterium]
MINVFLNNKSHSVEAEKNLYDFLVQHHQLKEYVAVTINNNLVVRRDFKTTLLKPNDRVDILVPMQGG